MFDRLTRRFVAETGGATAAEFAICAPILIILVFGLFALGWTQHSISSVRFGVQQASRQLSLNPATTQAEVEATVRHNAADVAATDLTVTLEISPDGAGGRTGIVRALYSRKIEVAGLLTMPVRHEVRMETALRQY